MSGVYVIEIYSRKGDNNILKIGSTAAAMIEGRISTLFDEKYGSEDYSFKIHDLIECPKSVRYNLENFLINTLICDYNVKPFEGREYFKCSPGITDLFISRLPDLVLDYYNSFQFHAQLDLGIGSILRARRKKMGLTQKQLSERLEMRQSTISELEQGKIKSYKNFKKLLDGLSLVILLREY